jgi:DNA polymerase-3 subunit beta
MFVTTKDVLSPALDVVRAALLKKADPPIHSHVLMDLRAGRLRLATNCQVLHAQTSLAVKGTNIALAVPGEIAEIVSRLEGTISFEPREQVLTVKSGGARLRLPCLGARDFPELTVQGVTSEWNVDAKDLLHALDFVEPAIAKQDLRLYLTGVLFQWGNGALTLVGSDGFAMGIVRMVVDKPLEAERILPAKTVSELIRMIKLQGTDQVRIVAGQQSVGFILGNCEIVSKVVDATYPNWSAIVSTTAKGGEGHRISVSRERLLDALDRVSLVARDEKRFVLEYAAGRLVLSATNGYQAAEEQVPAESADQGKMILNKAQVRTAVASIAGDQVTLSIAGPDKPVRFAGEKRTECYIVMPMKE